MPTACAAKRKSAFSNLPHLADTSSAIRPASSHTYPSGGNLLVAGALDLFDILELFVFGRFLLRIFCLQLGLQA